MKVHNDLKELLIDFGFKASKYTNNHRDRRNPEQFVDDYLSINSLALGNLLKIKIMAIYYQNKKGEQFKLEVKTANNKLIDKLLDQLNLMESDTIPKEEFKSYLGMMTIDVMDDENPDELIAVLTTKRIALT